MSTISKCIWPASALAIAATFAHADEPATKDTSPAIPYRSEAATAQDFSADPSKVTVEQRADGTVIYHLNGQGMQAMTATKGADGKIHYQCSDAADHAIATGMEKVDEK